MHSILSSRLRYCLPLGLVLILALAAGCSDGSDPGSPDPKIVLLEVLPASTRGLFQLTPDLVAGDGEWAEWLDDTVAPWRHSPLDIFRYYADGMDLVGNAEQLILAQPSLDGAVYALLADIGKGAGDDLLEGVATESGGEYRGFPLLRLSDNGLFLARLDDRTWVIAPRVIVEQLIDVHLGSLPGIEESVIFDYLANLDDTRPFNVVYGLAGLYGEVPVPGGGDSSLNPAVVVSAAFSVEQGVLDGSMQFVTPDAQTYTERLLGLLPEGSPGQIEATGEDINIDLTGLSATEDVPGLFKSLYIGMNAVDYADAVTQGGNPPWLNFDVGENPNSMFINFEFKDEAARESFEATQLPPGFTLAPQRILDTDEPRYFLMLNIYQSSGGLVEGARAEWSVFINDPDAGVPRFLVIQAVAASATVDPVNLLVLPEPVNYVVEPDALVSYVGVVDEGSGEEELYFTSRVNWPQSPQTQVYFSREFVAANDYIFWGNAVADRGMYNSSVYNRPAVLIGDSEISFVDNSRWTGFIKPAPVHTVVYLNPLEIVISPWWNLDADYLDVTEAYRQELIDFKNAFYPGLMVDIAEAAMRGERSTLSTTTSGEPLATAYYQFVIKDPEALLARVGAQGLFTPVAIPLQDNALPGMYLTLEVSESEGDPCGLRASWSMYVRNEENRVKTLQLETLSSDPCLDPVSMLGLPAAVEQEADETQLRTRLASPLIRFAATLDLSQGEDSVASETWIAAGDQVCSLNGVCDYTFYDGQTLVQPANRINFGGITIDEISTPWDDFIDTEPVEVTVRQFPVMRGINPWRNVAPFGT